MATTLSVKQSKNYTQESLKNLGHQLLSSRSHINNLPILISLLSPSASTEHCVEALLSVQSFFTPLVHNLPSPSLKHKYSPALENGDPETVYRIWLRSKFDQFIDSLIDLSVSSMSQDFIKEAALDALMEFVKMGKCGKFQSSIYYRFICSAVRSTFPIDILVGRLSSKYLSYIDVRYHTYVSLKKITRRLCAGELIGRSQESNGDQMDIPKLSEELIIRKIYGVLSQIPHPESEDLKFEWGTWSPQGISSKEADSNMSGDVLNPDCPELKKVGQSTVGKRIRLKFTEAWMSFLGLSFPLDIYKEVLASLHQKVMPYILKPVRLSDFLTRSYDIGGVISVMALGGLYILMTQHGLEYSNFYEKLYALLVPSTFMAKYRAKFFELLDSCFKTFLLPAYLAAAFAKRLSRLALFVPPSGSLIIIAIVHNLLRRHPSISFLVNQQNDGDTTVAPSLSNDESVTGMDMRDKDCSIDAFQLEESDPSKSNAMKSSLWELDTLRHHYCPSVSRFVQSLETDLTVRSKTFDISVKDFSAGSYATIFGYEMSRRIKQVPLAFYQSIPTVLFLEDDFPGWAFDSSHVYTSCKMEDGHEHFPEDMIPKLEKRQKVVA